MNIDDFILSLAISDMLGVAPNEQDLLIYNRYKKIFGDLQDNIIIRFYEEHIPIMEYRYDASIRRLHIASIYTDDIGIVKIMIKHLHPGKNIFVTNYGIYASVYCDTIDVKL